MNIFLTVLTLIVLVIIIYIIYRLSIWVYRHYLVKANDDIRVLNRPLLKSYLTGKYGKHGGKIVYKKVEKEILERFKGRVK